MRIGEPLRFDAALPLREREPDRERERDRDSRKNEHQQFQIHCEITDFLMRIVNIQSIYNQFQ